jgi:predicted molibdopterin-dependent oxidoreductase YjgC
VFPGYQKVTDAAARSKFENAWQTGLPDQNGLTLVEMMHAAERGELKAMYIMGEEPVLTDPDGNHVQKALKELDFLVVQNIFMGETGKYADVVLPGASFAEKDGTFTNTERRIQLVRRAIEPVGQSRPDWQIICQLSTRMGYGMEYRHPSDIMQEIAALTPSYGGITHDRLQAGGLQWPCRNESDPGTAILHQETFSRGLGKFMPTPYQPAFELPDGEYPLILTTGRVLYHWHAGTMSRQSPGLAEIYPQGVVEINPGDAGRIGCSSGDIVEVASRRGKICATAEVTTRSPEGVVFMTFHFKESPANLLTVDALDPVAKIPELKVCAVKISLVEVPDAARK